MIAHKLAYIAVKYLKAPGVRALGAAGPVLENSPGSALLRYLKEFKLNFR